MITLNVSKEDGIINGMMGTLKQIEYRNGIPATLFMDFPYDSQVGKYRRSHYKCQFPDQTNNGWVPIKRVVQSFRVPKRGSRKSTVTVERCQFPVEFCAATTIFKYQGKSASSLEIDLSGYAFKGGAYTALTRCTSMEGNRLVSDILPRNVIPSPHHPTLSLKCLL